MAWRVEWTISWPVDISVESAPATSDAVLTESHSPASPVAIGTQSSVVSSSASFRSGHAPAPLLTSHGWSVVVVTRRPIFVHTSTTSPW